MSAFTQVKSLRPGRSVFDLSYEKKFDFDVGQLIPVCCEEMVPGDTFKIGNEIVINSMPLNAPVYHKLDVTVHYFFCPTRLVFDKWEDFITGGKTGNDATVLPRFQSSEYTSGGALYNLFSDSEIFGPYSLYDYFGFPVMKDSNNFYAAPGNNTVNPHDASYFFKPLIFP